MLNGSNFLSIRFSLLPFFIIFAALNLRNMKNKTFGSVPLLKVAICLMAGIVVGMYVPMGVPLLLAVVTGLLLLALLLWRYEHGQSIVIAMCFVGLGWLLIQRQKEALRVAWPEGEVCYEAVVVSEPVEKPKTVAVDILLTKSGKKLKAYFYKEKKSKEPVEKSRSLRIGDGLKIRSRIQPNSYWRRGTFDYRRYLEIHGFAGQTFVSTRKWQKAEISLGSLSRMERTRLFFLKFRHRLLNRLEYGNDSIEPYALHSQLSDAQSVVAAMTLGDKSALTKELKEVYSVTGASHVLALSGLHLGIIYGLLVLLTGGRRQHIFHSLLFTFHFFAIWAFVFLVGMPVSLVRSAVMLSTYALLSLGRRDKMSVNTLAFTAIVLLMLNPLSLFDVGFQLSFMAVFAIIVWVPLFRSRLWGMVAVSLAAQMGTAPLIAYYFGRFSTYFLLTNFIVIPAATLILWLSFVVLLFPSLAYLLLYVVSGLNSVLTHLASLPGASIEGLCPSLLQVVMVYVIITAFYLLCTRVYSTGRT